MNREEKEDMSRFILETNRWLRRDHRVSSNTTLAW